MCPVICMFITTQVVLHSRCVEYINTNAEMQKWPFFYKFKYRYSFF